MFFWHKICYNLLNFLIKKLVKSKIIPKDPIKELHISTTCLFLYVLPYYSKIDLLILRKQCYLIGLPDPLNPIKINDIKLPAYIFINDKSYIFYSINSYKKSAKIFTTYLNLHYHDPKLNIQILPVSVMLGRLPEKINYSSTAKLKLLNCIHKIFNIIWLGRDSFIKFSPTISLNQIANKYGTDKFVINKLIRVARIYYIRQRLVTIGPKLFTRRDILNKLLTKRTIEKAIEDEAKIKKIPIKKAKNNAITIIEEIIANFSYETVRITDRILSWTWNKLYQGINVQHIEHVNYLAQKGYEIVYIPSHRSHMDYLLLSYILYHHGLVPPHIVAGINLNFWPAGPIFRKLGAFFIRRSFRGNKLYYTIFCEYLNELFNHGYPIEYFIEGKRSRTGKLLEPKTGILSITLQAMLRSNSRPIIIVPIYIGYEHILEVSTYSKELKGIAKKKESFFLMLKALCKLRRLGQGYVNFGQPIILTQYLNKYAPEWSNYINNINHQRPIWLNSIVNLLAHKIMVKINDSAAANAINLCSTILLASHQYVLTKKQLIEQIDCYLQLLKNVPYSFNTTIPNKTSKQLLENALKLHKFKIKHVNTNDIIILPHKNINLMTYYRNNIIHLLTFPSLIANIVLHNKSIQRQKINYQATMIYPLLKAELFIRYNTEEVHEFIDTLLNELARQQLILLKTKGFITINSNRIQHLQLLASIIKEILQRYAITLSLLNTNNKVNQKILEKENYLFAQHLSVAHGANTSEFFDKALFSTLVNTLKQEGYINKKNGTISTITNIKSLHQIIIRLVPDIKFLLNKKNSLIKIHNCYINKII